VKRKLECQFKRAGKGVGRGLHGGDGWGVAAPSEGHSPQWPMAAVGVEQVVPVVYGNVELILRRSIVDRELLQHFEAFTSKVLAMSPTIWRTHVLQVALRVSIVHSCHQWENS
jgi:hypothetical protein